jgi:hypothetical protein
MNEMENNKPSAPDQAIADAAKAYVQALADIAAIRKRRGHGDYKSFESYKGSTSFPVRIDREMQMARAARKRTLRRLRRAVEVLFEFLPIGQER